MSSWRLRIQEIRKTRAFRIVRGLAAWLMVVELAYLLVANVILASGAVQKFVNETQSAHLEFHSSYSLFPMLVHVTNLRLRYQDHNMQFALAVSSADVRVNPLWLLKKRFSASSVRASDVTFLFRHKLARVQGNEDALALYPPISGFSDPPLLGIAKVSNPQDLWSFELQDVDATIRELWFMTYRYLGPARATGSFQLIPYRNLQVGPAHLSLFSGVLHSGKSKVLSHHLHAEVDLYLQPVNPEALTGMASFVPIVAEVQLGMRLEDLEPVNLYLPDATPMRVTRGGGILTVAATLAHGKVGPRSSISYAMLEPVRVERPPLAAEGSLMLQLSVSDSKAVHLSGNAARIDLLLSHAPASSAPSLAVAEHVDGTAEFTELNVIHSIEPLQARLDVPIVRSSNLKGLDTAIQGDRSWHLQAGAAVFAGAAQFRGSTLTRAEVRGDFEALQVRLNEHEIWAYGTLASTYIDQKGQPSEIQDAELLLNNVTTRSQDRVTPNWWASVGTTHMQLAGSLGKQVGGTFVVRAKNADPVLKALDIPGILRAFIPRKPVEVVAQIERQGASTRLSLIHAQTGNLRVSGELLTQPRHTSGVFRVEGVAVPIGIELDDGQSHITLFANADWLNRHLQDLNGGPQPVRSTKLESSQGIKGPAHGGLGSRSPVAQR